jgi:lipopolysaccharide transport system permease protein
MSNVFRQKQTYFVLFACCAIVVLLGIILPRQYAQPVLYRATVTVDIDRERYAELYDANGVLDGDFEAVRYQANRIMAARYAGFGESELATTITQTAAGIVVTVDATSAAFSQQIANEYADMLVLTIRAAGGREILRNLLGWEITLAVQGESAADEPTRLLREFLRRDVFVFNRPVEPVSLYTPLQLLPVSDQYDLLRAVEYRDAELTFIEIPGNDDAEVVQRLRAKIAAIDDFESAMLVAYPSLVFVPTQPDVVWRSQSATLPTTSLPRNIGWAIMGAIGAGIALAVLLYLFDRSVDVVNRINEIWRYRVLLVYLVQRNLLIRYKNSVLGFAWTQIVPIAQLLVYWVVFGYFLKGNAYPMFPLFVVAGLLPWLFTSEAVALAVRSVHDNATLVRQAYFPREVLPISSVFTSMVNFVFSLPVLFIFMVLIRYLTYGTWSVPWTIVYLPVILLVHLIFLVGLALLLAALAIYFIDTIHFVGIFLQIWFFLNPIVYSLTIVNQSFARVVRWVNPMASIVEYYREVIYGLPQIGVLPTPGIPAAESILRTLLTGLVILACGYWLFRRVHDSISERL